MENLKITDVIQTAACILVESQDDYNTLMSDLEKMGLLWSTDDLPTTFNCYKNNPVIICIFPYDKRIGHALASGFPATAVIDFEDFYEKITLVSTDVH